MLSWSPFHLLYRTILYYTILYYTILYYTILYYTILYYTILYYTILSYTTLNSINQIQQVFATIERYMERQGVLKSGVLPSVYPYNFSNKKLPDWSSAEGKSSKNNSWLLTIACIMRDLVCAMVKMGEFRVVLPLHKLSEDILHSIVHKERRRKRNKDAAAVGDRSRAGSFTNRSESGSELDKRTDTTGDSKLLNPADLNPDSDASSDVSDVPSPVTDTMYLRSFLASNSMDSEKGNPGDHVHQPRAGKTISDLPTNQPVTISNYSALLLDNTASVDHILTVHILSYIRGYEALALWNILRGNPPLALKFIDSAINALQRSESSCLVLYSLCFGRLLALKSMCYPADSQMDGMKCLEEALMWVKKSKERSIWGCIQHFNGSILPQLPGLKDLHRADTGEWVVLVVSALGLCGVGKWKEGGKLFYAAQIELKEINDRASLFQIKLLHAWALFMVGDLLTFHTMMHSITSHTKQNEERFIGVSSGILLAIRFSISCFYDAADSLITKVKVTGTPVTSPISTPKTPSPRSSIQMRNQSFSTLSFSMSGPSQLGSTIFLRVSEAFLVSRRNASDLSITDITILCAKMAIRTPCTYIGGIYLFFTALAALAVYEHTIVSSENSDSGSVVSREGGREEGEEGGDGGKVGRRDEDGSQGLLEGIEGVLQTLHQLSMKHTVLLYMSRAMHARYYRVKGCLSDVIRFAVLNTDMSPGDDSYTSGCSPSSTSTSIPHPAESLPLGNAYLRMEIVLCQQALYDVSESTDSKSRRINKILAVGRESIELFTAYEANIEIEVLRACISNAEDLRKQSR